MTEKANFSDKTLVAASTMLVELDSLSTQWKEFETTELARTNQRLYELLGLVYKKYQDAKHSQAVMTKTIELLKERMRQQGRRVQDNMSALSLFVRYVFNSDRRAIFNYTQAIQAAISNDISPEGLVDYITVSGGVDGCKKKAQPIKESTINKKRKIEEAMPLVEELVGNDSVNCIAKFKVDQKMVQDVHGKTATFMIGVSDQYGNVEVRAVIPAYSAAFENWAKTKLAEYLAEQSQAAGKQTKESAVQDAMDQLLQKATSTVIGEVDETEVASV